jgi:hypothetical protein
VLRRNWELGIIHKYKPSYFPKFYIFCKDEDMGLAEDKDNLFDDSVLKPYNDVWNIIVTFQYISISRDINKLFLSSNSL